MNRGNLFYASAASAFAEVQGDTNLRADLLNSVVIPGKLPTSIQWMPPGTQNICPWIGGQPTPLKITVDKQLCDELDAQLQQMRRDAATGQGDVPYLDLNHDDAEASAEVLSLEWRGDDPATGGIWANVKWTAAGKEALLGGNYRRFSPQWTVDGETKQVVGIGVNMGGLVNRAAFRNIRPVMAKGHAGMIARGISGEHRLVALAKAHAAQNKVSLSQAVEAMAKDNTLYSEYRTALLKLRPESARQTVVIVAGKQPFLDEVATVQATGKSFDESVRIVSLKKPLLYEGYQISMRGAKDGAEIAR